MKPSIESNGAKSGKTAARKSFADSQNLLVYSLKSLMALNARHQTEMCSFKNNRHHLKSDVNNSQILSKCLNPVKIKEKQVAPSKFSKNRHQSSPIAKKVAKNKISLQKSLDLLLHSLKSFIAQKINAPLIARHQTEM
jgi:hypothetical protein